MNKGETALHHTSSQGWRSLPPAHIGLLSEAPEGNICLI